MTATGQQTFTVTYDQLVRLRALGERATRAASDLDDINMNAGDIVYEIAGPFATDDDADAFFGPFDKRVDAEAEVALS